MMSSDASLPSLPQRPLTAKLQAQRPKTGFEEQEDFKSKIRKDGKTSARHVYKRQLSHLGQDPDRIWTSSHKLGAVSPQACKSSLVSPQTSKETLESQLSGRQTVAAQSEVSDSEWTFSELNRFEEIHRERIGSVPALPERYSPASRLPVPRLDLQRIEQNQILTTESSRDSIGSPTSLQIWSPMKSSRPEPQVLVVQSPGAGSIASQRCPTARIPPFSARDANLLPSVRHTNKERPLTDRPPTGITASGMGQLPPKTKRLTNSIDRFFVKETPSPKAKVKLHLRNAMNLADAWGEHIWTGGVRKERPPFTPSWLLLASQRTRTVEMRKEKTLISRSLRGRPLIGAEVDPVPGIPVQVADGRTGVKVIPEFAYRDPIDPSTTLHGNLNRGFRPSGGPDTDEWRQLVQRHVGAQHGTLWSQPRSDGSRTMPVGFRDFRSTLDGSAKSGWTMRPISPRTNGRSGTWLLTGKSRVEKEMEMDAGGAYFLGEHRLPGWHQPRGRKGGGWREGALAMVWEKEVKELKAGGWDNWNFYSLKSRMGLHDHRGLDEPMLKLERDWKLFLSAQGLKPREELLEGDSLSTLPPDVLSFEKPQQQFVRQELP